MGVAVSERLILILSSVMSPCCCAPVVSGCPPRQELRCTACGHRTARPGRPAPKPTRRMPPWTWPGELLGRKLARESLETAVAPDDRLRE